MSRTPPKLHTNITTSKAVIASPRTTQPRKKVQKGARFWSVVCTTRGTIEIPKAIDVNAIVPSIHLPVRSLMWSFGTFSDRPVHLAQVIEKTKRTSVLIKQISSGFTRLLFIVWGGVA